jgi:hypothetical protein
MALPTTHAEQIIKKYNHRHKNYTDVSVVNTIFAKITKKTPCETHKTDAHGDEKPINV